MPHHLIFGHPELEIWISYPTIHTVEKSLPTVHNTWPLHIRCYNFVFITLNFQTERDVTDVYESIQRLTCVSSVEQLYAFVYTPSPPFSTKDGWQIYDPLVEYERMGVSSRNEQWRFSDLNKTFTFSPTYPRVLVVPSKISDAVLTYAAKHRSKARIPALSYLHWNNMASITRSSQPMVGLKQNRSIQDEKLIEAIFLTNTPQSPPGHQVYGSTATNLIIDARPTANAVANTAVGAGTENMENYRNCKKVYSGIDNIHVMRDSLNKLVEALQEIDTKGTVSKASLQRSGWLKHIGAIMEGALMIVKNIHVSSSHVLVHCSDGWDRTAQLTSVAQICLDPFYRTLRGFQVLVEKEWCSFGYKFMDRCGHLSNDKNFVALSATNAAANTFANVQSKFYNNKHIRETSPVFQQFLDCVFQIMHQNPTRFEFNEYFLTQLHYHVYSCQFGNFLFNCERERRQYMATTKCASVWDFINSDKDVYLSKTFQPSADKDRAGDGGVLFPDSKNIKYWAKLFGRTDEELNAPDDNMSINNPMTGRMTPEMLGLEANYAESIASIGGDILTGSDPLGASSGSITSQPRAGAKNITARPEAFATAGTIEGEDSWQKSAENITSKFPAALTGAFSGGLVDSFNRLTMNVRDTWYASTAVSGASSANSFGEDLTSPSSFKEMRPSSASPQYRAATLGRSSSNSRRTTVDREMRSISGGQAIYAQTHSASSSPKHSLADLTLEHEIHQSYAHLGQQGARKSPPNGSSSSSSNSRPSFNTRHSHLSSKSNSSTVKRSATPDLTTTLPASSVSIESGIAAAVTVAEKADSGPEPAKEPVKELPHPLFVE
ncbi:protein-tyrosine phosphatase-like protein [Lobosporangium transversale]|uniref:Protein-tyrosine phosphatase-like protein n=1 Tax=Lobosporangium transversale TaxID=64571 RepID=A0A1Y2GRE4_9FUNG|nr:protein-tyrosine phosphatase-like protein [Lobosporangium transversale]ORZ15412.1 protein-tyrosine phosphatase-like protein [Lobosporangium transversale]|eukprot:XP_021881160.1 protein-tyrosine phosphatase-like protein [Lobosporangium transversale]